MSSSRRRKRKRKHKKQSGNATLDNINTRSGVRLPNLSKLENKSIFEGVEGYIRDVYLETNRVKPINFTSQKYKKYIKLMD